MVGLVVEEVMTDFCGEIVAVDRDLGTLTLEDRRNRRRAFPLGPGFLLEGRPVVLTAPVSRPATSGPRRTASGSLAVPGARARVARESRIYVEGRHDAELVEKVWGDDLRVEGVVVEHLGGVDELMTALGSRSPARSSARRRRRGARPRHLPPAGRHPRPSPPAPRRVGPRRRSCSRAPPWPSHRARRAIPTPYDEGRRSR